MYVKLYKELDIKEGQQKAFKLEKARNKSTRDIKHVRQIKDMKGGDRRENRYFNNNNIFISDSRSIGRYYRGIK